MNSGHKMKQREMRIGSCVLDVENDVARLSARITCDDGQPRELWYSLPAALKDWFITGRSDGFVVGLLHQAMERNEDIVTADPMSSRLWHGLQNIYIPMMTQAFPGLHPIKIIPASLTNEVKPARGVATGFSGGIDSFAAVVRHFARETSPDHRVTHFLFHNVGSHGDKSAGDDRRLFRQRYEIVQPFAREAGIPTVPVDSNLAYVFPINFLTMHHALNTSVLLVLQNQFHRYFYASTYQYADCGVAYTDDIARFDPFAFHLFSTETLDCISTGGEMSRVEKTRLVATYEPSHRFLNVCVNPAFEGRNCSDCFKCRRTMLTLELLGLDHLYHRVFDFKKFAGVRRQYLKSIILHKPHSFEAEIADAFYARRSWWWKYLLQAGRWVRKHRQYRKK